MGSTCLPTVSAKALYSRISSPDPLLSQLHPWDTAVSARPPFGYRLLAAEAPPGDSPGACFHSGPALSL